MIRLTPADTSPLIFVSSAGAEMPSSLPLMARVTISSDRVSRMSMTTRHHDEGRPRPQPQKVPPVFDFRSAATAVMMMPMAPEFHSLHGGHPATGPRTIARVLVRSRHGLDKPRARGRQRYEGRPRAAHPSPWAITITKGIIHGHGQGSPDDYSASDSEHNSDNDFDHDLFNGKVPSDQEAHGVRGEPRHAGDAGFEAATRTGRFQLAPDSGAPPMRFGVDAGK